MTERSRQPRWKAALAPGFWRVVPRDGRIAAGLFAALFLSPLWSAESAQARESGTRRDAAQTSATASYSHTLTGKVVRVSDGDTFNLLVGSRQQRVRLASIDAPETTQSRERPGQPYANVSREALADMIAGKTLTLQCFEKDRYERHICDVPLGDGSTANQRMVAQGMAWANREGRGRFLRDDSLDGLERNAKAKRLGLWQDAKPVQPWVWRYRCWRQGQCD